MSEQKYHTQPESIEQEPPYTGLRGDALNTAAFVPVLLKAIELNIQGGFVEKARARAEKARSKITDGTTEQAGGLLGYEQWLQRPENSNMAKTDQPSSVHVTRFDEIINKIKAALKTRELITSDGALSPAWGMLHNFYEELCSFLADKNVCSKH